MTFFTIDRLDRTLNTLNNIIQVERLRDIHPKLNSRIVLIHVASVYQSPAAPLIDAPSVHQT